MVLNFHGTFTKQILKGTFLRQAAVWMILSTVGGSGPSPSDAIAWWKVNQVARLAPIVLLELAVAKSCLSLWVALRRSFHPSSCPQSRSAPS